VAAVHSGLSQPREQATARLLAAIRHPCVDLIAHPTGRLLGRREAIDLDMESLFQAARESGVALEINAHPNRLDLNDVYLRRAAEAGVMLAISSDAHDGEGFAVLPYGVAMARRGWLEPHQLLNTRPAEAVRAWKRQRHS
jgi:DNA polymerase (family 10)